MSPPEHALVLCCDEKSQVQALDRTQPGLPMKKGRCCNHDPRLQAQRNDHAICRTQRTRWPGHLPMPAASSSCRVVEVSQTERPRDAKGKGTAFNCRPLRYAQTPKGSGVAGQTSSNHHALHAHQRFVAQDGGAVPSRHQRKATTPWCVHQCG